MSELPATELLAVPSTGRTFTAERTVRLGDVDASGRLRYDSIGRYLQDVASDDALAAGLPNAMGWVVRRTMVRIDAPAVLNEPVTLTTFCTGSGRSWAERRTSIKGGDGSSVEAVSLWIQVDVTTGRPARLGDEFFEIYGEAAAGRVVSSKLRLPSPTPTASARPWQFRETDLDPFDHVNNAAQWAVVEALIGGRDRPGIAEIEYLAPVDLGEVELVVDGGNAWLVAGGRVVSAFAMSNLP